MENDYYVFVIIGILRRGDRGRSLLREPKDTVNRNYVGKVFIRNKYDVRFSLIFSW